MDHIDNVIFEQKHERSEPSKFLGKEHSSLSMEIEM